MLADVTPLSMAPRQQQTNLDHTKTPQGFLQNNKQIWNSERTSKDLYKPGMHGTAFFASGQGGAEEKFFGLGCGGVTVKLGAYSGWGGAGRGSLENFRGRGGAGRASLLKMIIEISLPACTLLILFYRKTNWQGELCSR